MPSFRYSRTQNSASIKERRAAGREAGAGRLGPGAGRLGPGAGTPGPAAGTLGTGAGTLETGAGRLGTGAGRLGTGAGTLEAGAGTRETAEDGHVVAAPDKFKGSLTAAEAAAHIAAGLRAARPDLDVRQVPVADGGDGTVAAAVAAGYQPVRLTVLGPAGQRVGAQFAWQDGTAIIEAAQACGLALLARLPGRRAQPLTATSFGVGELIAAAVARGARRIVLGLGGVASSDGGAGMVQALGGRLLDSAGRDLPPGGAALATLDRLDLAALAPLAGIEVLAACDVDSPLLGEHGAAAVYGPQKGASPADVRALETGLARWADTAERTLASRGRRPASQHDQARAGTAAGQQPPAQHDQARAGTAADQPPPAQRDQARAGIAAGQPPPAQRYRDQPGAGAAGGLGFAALAFLGATLRPGIELMLDLTGFAALLDGARLVVTGEGSLDVQTLRGKAPAGVARAVASARAAAPAGRAPRLPVIAVAGTCTLTAGQLRSAGIDAAYCLTDLEPDAQRCLALAGPLLEEITRLLAADWLPATSP